MSNHGITVENLLRTLPEPFKTSEKCYSIAMSIANELVKPMPLIRMAAIYTQIDSLPEEVLDILAYDFKVDWWSYDYSVEEKRQTLKDSWYVHKHLGTKGSVETAISAIYPGTKVEEWYTYNGAPFHFNLAIPVERSELDASKHSVVLSLINFYKNLRSILDEVQYYGSIGDAVAYTAAACIGIEIVDSAKTITREVQ